MNSGKKSVHLVFDGKHWTCEDKHITFVPGAKAIAEVDAASINEKGFIRKKPKPFKVKIFDDGDELHVAVKAPKYEDLPSEIRRSFYHDMDFKLCHESGKA